MAYITENRICQNCKENFPIEPEDFNFYEKMKVPPPTFCPMCRAQRRLAWRNERKLFKVKNFLTGENMFSTYPAESGRKIMTREEWFGDNWDPMEHALDIDFTKPFFQQIEELSKVVPVYNFNNTFINNSPYVFNASYIKNSYLIVNSNYSEDCMYGNGVDSCKNCVDNSHIKNCERCYECFWLENCYQCYFSIMCAESYNLYFCRNCLGCNDCFGCANLRKLSYCIFNKKYTKEEYEKEIKKMNLNSTSGILEARKKARLFWLTQPTKYQHGLKNLNSSGSHVTNCKNVNDSYLIRESENMRYCQYMQVPGNKDNYDSCNWGEHTELNYETLECGENSYNNKFSRSCWPSSRNNEYCHHLFSSSDCFGCVGLKKKQYCILNKQYSKEEYEKLIPQIKKHMEDMPYVDSQGLVYKYGEFFPIELSPLGYNNTVAIQHFPLTEAEAKNKGYLWIDVPRGEYKITKKASELTESITEIDDEILKEVIECEKCKNPYKILENEFLFYKKENLPLPTLCHECRFERRIEDRLKLKLEKRSCMCAGSSDKTNIYKNTIKHFHGDEPCKEEFKTGHISAKKEIVYCERCYQSEVY
ncbi:MAG: hypothetical protein PHT16_02840 [Candidatus Pacebacteria bacterium]|nr:hypothetical protein [Candidatus Paceibacterota bacterium]